MRKFTNVCDNQFSRWLILIISTHIYGTFPKNKLVQIEEEVNEGRALTRRLIVLEAFHIAFVVFLLNTFAFVEAMFAFGQSNFEFSKTFFVDK